MSKYRPRHLVLKDFIRVLNRHNPMELSMPDNPGKDSEYDGEALSILARFQEGMINMCHDEERALSIVEPIIQEAFGFWFGEHIADPARLRALAAELLQIFNRSYPRAQPEQPAPQA